MLPVRFYLPPEDVRTQLLEPSDRRTYCAYKGAAHYLSAPGGRRRLVLPGAAARGGRGHRPDRVLQRAPRRRRRRRAAGAAGHALVAPLDNGGIADWLEAFASLLELSEANPYSARAYRRAAETIRAAPVPIEPLVRDGRVRELRGIGSSIESKLRELVETGRIAELAELERELSPGLIGLGRFLGLSARRSVDLARGLDARTPEEFRDAVAAGRLRAVPGVGPKLEAQIVAALERPPERPALLLPRAQELVAGIAAALDGEPAGDPRRWRDACEVLRVVSAAPDALERFAALPQIVAMVEPAVGLTVEGVPVELVVAEPGGFGTAVLRATGADAYVAALEPLPEAADEPAVYAALGIPWSVARSTRSRGSAPSG